jgi:hypothetical protein
MPLPLIIGIGVPIVTGLLGLGKGVKAGFDTKHAKDVNVQANSVVDDAKASLDVCRTKSGKSLEALGSKKIYVLDTNVMRFIASYEKLKNVDFTESAGLNELNKLRLDKQSMEELKKMGGYAASLLSGTVGGALGGTLMAFGAYNGVIALGAAGTGTAISSLGGIAAYNATMAFLGGGTLASGGLGVAGGVMVLGGLVAGPALAIMGLVVGAKASANLHKAYANLAEAKKIAEELKTVGLLCNSIRRRGYMFQRLLIRLDALFCPLVYQLEKIINTKGVDFKTFDQAEKESIAKAVALVVAIKAILDTPILTDEGKLTEESEKIAIAIRATIKSNE